MSTRSRAATGLERELAPERELFDRGFSRLFSTWRGIPRVLSAAMRYAVLGGKRVRPALMVRAFRAAGGRRLPRVLPFCYGVEMIHTFSLVHDDLPCMDDDDFRRGRPTLHRKFGEGLAVLAADALLVDAFGLFAAAPGPDAPKLEATRLLARAVGPRGMTAGQVLDIASEARLPRGGGRPASGPGVRIARSLERINELKTADFVASCVVAGAVLGGLSARLRPALLSAGTDIGHLFQLTDDLLDAGTEVDRGLVAVRGELWVRRRAERLSSRATDILRSLGPRFGGLAALPALIAGRSV